MNDHQLGALLRHQIMADLQRGIPSDGRRLQALMGDLCGERQMPLLPALRYLVTSQAFSSAIGQAPPLPTDSRLQLRLQQELDQVFTAAICLRMTAVLRGLLGLPEVESAHGRGAGVLEPSVPDAPSPPVASMPQVGDLRNGWPIEELIREQAGYERAATGGNKGVVAVLSFMAGVLVVGVLGALGWMVQINRQPLQANTSQGTGQLPAETASKPTQQQEPSTTQPPPAPDLGTQQANTDLAIASVQQLYTDISSGNFDGARQLFSPAAADQFDPTFFSQFQQVSVSDLRANDSNGSTVSLTGVVTFVYPDNTTQSESRSFTVDTSTQPALITDSSFGAVLKPRDSGINNNADRRNSALSSLRENLTMPIREQIRRVRMETGAGERR